MAALQIIDNILKYIDNNIVFNCPRGDSHSHLQKHADWGYGRETGPACWAHIAAKWAPCSGKHQSPIDITTDCKPKITENFNVQDDKKWDLNIKYDVLDAIKTTIVNNGHTIQVNVQEGKCYIELYNKRYVLKQLHFHTPSEHTENGVHFPMEMHLVHQNNDDQSIAVIGFFFDTNKHLNNYEKLQQNCDDLKQESTLENDDTDSNEFLAQFWSYLPQKNKENHDAFNVKAIPIENDVSFVPLIQNCITDKNEKKQVEKIDHVSLHLDLFYYEGSLTTPPCTEGVKWMVIKTAQLMSLKQLVRFHRKLNHLHNARNTQKANERIVHLVSKVQLDMHQ